MKSRLIAIAAFMAAASLLAGAQEVSKKKEIAIFALSHYDWNIPDGALGSIDEEIKSVFINIGRFDIAGMSYRLAESDVQGFIDRIKEYKQQNAQIPERFQMGQEIFTEADMNELIGSFIVVVPAVTFFDVKREEKKTLMGTQTTGYSAEVKTSFTFINVEEAKTMAQFFVDSTGSDENRNRAIQDAINGIPVQLEYEITKVPEFTLKTGVLEKTGFSEVVIELGRNMGIRKGYEFSLIESRIMSTGSRFDAESGLMVVKEVGEEVSIARVIYGSPQVGDQLKEVPRVGFESTPYLDVLFDPTNTAGSFYSLLGVRVVATKGFYDLRPLFGLEFPLPIAPKESLLPLMWVVGFPFNVYIGGEYTMYMRRMLIRPRAGFGFGMLVPWFDSGDEPVVTHLGGFISTEVSWIINRDWAFSTDVGYKLWYGVYDGLIALLDAQGEFGRTSYGGVQIGVGISRKF